MEIEFQIVKVSSLIFMVAFIYFSMCVLASFDKEQIRESYKRGGGFYLFFIAKWNNVTKKYSILSLISMVLVVVTLVLKKYLNI